MDLNLSFFFSSVFYYTVEVPSSQDAIVTTRIIPFLGVGNLNLNL